MRYLLILSILLVSCSEPEDITSDKLVGLKFARLDKQAGSFLSWPDIYEVISFTGVKNGLVYPASQHLLDLIEETGGKGRAFKFTYKLSSDDRIILTTEAGVKYTGTVFGIESLNIMGYKYYNHKPFKCSGSETKLVRSNYIVACGTIPNIVPCITEDTLGIYLDHFCTGYRYEFNDGRVYSSYTKFYYDYDPERLTDNLILTFPWWNGHGFGVKHKGTLYGKDSLFFWERMYYITNSQPPWGLR
jgi:hypothetical protein